VIEIRELSVAYDGRQVLNDISFDLPPGRIIVLLGANGAGKTTLLRALNASVPITNGSVMLDGADIRTMSRGAIAKRIAVVAQENETKFPVTVMEFVLAGRFAHGRAFGWESSVDLRHAEEAIASCDLDEFRGRMMNELSGGERQRVVLARAMAAGASVLLLDEPTANLDLAHQASMFRLIRERCAKDNMSAAVITHDLNLAAEFADEIIMLSDGRQLAKGAPADVLNAENLRTVYRVNVFLDTNPVSRKVRVTTLY
jgi:iron complex transport system ATP-binding protein